MGIQVGFAGEISEMPRIDYGKHPAFAVLEAAATVLPQVVSREIAAADAALETIDAAVREEALTGERLRTLKRTRRELERQSDALIARVREGLVNARGDWTDWEIPVLRKYLYSMSREYKRYLRHQSRCLRHVGSDLRRPGGSAGHVLQQLQSTGAAPARIEAGAKTALREMVDPYVVELRDLDARSPNQLSGKGLTPTHRHFWKALKTAIQPLQLAEAAGAYLGYPVSLTAVGLAVNAPGNRFFNSRYSDVGLPSSRAAGMHFDSSCGMLKAMLYLSHVGPEDGAFSYVLGSHKWALSHFRRFSGQALPYAGVTLDNPQARQFFVKLPDPLRQLSHFGADFIPGDERESMIVDNETTFTSESADVILFDNYGLHRGGVLPKHERIALQLQFSPVRERVMELAGKYVYDRWIAGV